MILLMRTTTMEVQMSGRLAPLAEEAWRRRGAAAALGPALRLRRGAARSAAATRAPEASLPAGAIAVGPDLYQVPIGDD